MKRLTQLTRAVLILGLVLFVKGNPSLVRAQTQSKTQEQTKETKSTRDAPPDTWPYTRSAVPEDSAPKGIRAIPLVPAVFIVDAVVNNTDPNLANTDTFNDGETSIAINPANPDEVVMTAFSGGWGTNAPLWHSTDSGNIWTKQFTIPNPPPNDDGCPCDQAVDYGRANLMSGTFLIHDFNSPPPPPFMGNVVSGTTTDPANAASWAYLLLAGITQLTNNLVPTSIGNSDQPWLLVNRDPVTATQDNVYVAYDDFGTNPRDMRIAVSFGVNPPNFTIDNQSGTATTGVNPGHRLAVDPRNGFVYSLFQRRTGAGDGDSQNIDFMLNRSTDGGATGPERNARWDHSCQCR
jgi:hypothetical protein